MLRVLDIVAGTSVDGPGLRTSVYFAGCGHHCEGCHNPQSWDFDGGSLMSVDEIMKIIVENDFNVTFSGGDPVYQLDELIELAARIREKGYTIWLYTGFLYEELVRMEGAQKLMCNIEAVVDGPYIAALRDTSLHFRGSSNQRIIYVNP